MPLTVLVNAGPWVAVPPPGHGGSADAEAYLDAYREVVHRCRLGP
jgi:hypothetical protein